MKTNMGAADRIIRFIVGVVFFIIAFLVLNGAWQILFWIIGGILILTAVVGICPLYIPFKFSTKK